MSRATTSWASSRSKGCTGAKRVRQGRRDLCARREWHPLRLRAGHGHQRVAETTIKADRGRLDEDDIRRMIEDARKNEEGDSQFAEKARLRNALEEACYTAKKTASGKSKAQLDDSCTVDAATHDFGDARRTRTCAWWKGRR